MRRLLTSVAALALMACTEAQTDDASATPPAAPPPVAQVEQSMDELLAVLNSDASDEERLAALDRTLSQVKSAVEDQEEINAVLDKTLSQGADAKESDDDDALEAEREKVRAMLEELDEKHPWLNAFDTSKAFEAPDAPTPPPAPGDRGVADQPRTEEGPLMQRAGAKLSQMRQSDWPTRVLIGGTQKRLIRRSAALAALEEKDAPAVQRYLSEMDKSGDPYRHHIRALASYSGVGMPKNENAVLGYAEAAVEGGVVDAFPIMHAIYLSGIGVEPDPVKARLWHLRAMEARLPDSYKMFGDAIVNGTYGPINPAFAQHVLEHSENGFGHAKQAALAELLISGDGGRRDLAEAHEIAKGLAEVDWDEDIKAQGEALLKRPEFAAAGFTAEN